MATATNDLFASLVSDIKSYTGKDPILPWLRGIKKMKESLPSNVLKEKLPRFLQKCAETFESDRRYRNDLRYLRVWLQLMDYVDEPRALLRTMEMNSIGKKRSLFYQAYALYYEKLKKFEEAEKMYHLGVQNLAEPVDELHKSYDQFLHRMEKHNTKKNQHQGRRAGRIPLAARKDEESKDNASANPAIDRISGGTSTKTNHVQKNRAKDMSIQQEVPRKESEKSRMFHGEDTVVVKKFVDRAIVGKSEAEDACHHGLVEPTINMKEAMNAINSMFREPIETAPTRRSKTSQSKEQNPNNNGFNVFIDEDSANETKPSHKKEENNTSLQIFVDDDENEDIITDENGYFPEAQNMAEGFVFLRPKDIPSEKLGEDTVVRRFVGSAIWEEPAAVENVCHHGLVDPTINLKEAMDDINNMFGKPMEFVRSKRAKKHEKAAVMEEDFGGFSILPDDEFEDQKVEPQPATRSSSRGDNELFEPTVFTKEAMDDINKLFGMPLDF
ncbi:mitotic spindle checkpoint protein BUBR1 [Euphorbia lathyris]|uniref:mitotic spindle checkpoint protein BUBR1 n=1 Tax=Euphorbia lathyris TaxID=212925 RepID=UPI0033141D01